MSNSRKPSSSRNKKSKIKRKVDDFSKGIGVSPLRLVFSGVLLLGIGYLIYTVAFSDRDVKNEVAKPSGFKLDRQNLTMEQRLTSMMDTKIPPSQNFLTTIDQIYDQNNELTEFEANLELSESQQIKIDQVRLRNKGVVVMLMTNNKVPCETEKADLIQFCSEYLDSPDEALHEKARFWLCVVPASHFFESPSPETLEGFVTAIETYPMGYLKSPGNAIAISTMLQKLIDSDPNAREFGKKGLSAFSRQLEKSELQSIRNMVPKLEGIALFGEFNIPTLAYRILWSDPSGPKDLEGVLGVLAEHPQSDTRIWVAIIKAYESFLSTDKIEEIGSAWQKTTELAKNVKDPEKKKTLDGILARQRTRAMAIGTQFDVSGETLPDGKPLSLGELDYTAIVFCDKSKRSFGALGKLGREASESQFRYHAVLAFSDELSQKDLDSLHLIPNDIAVVDHKTATRYMEALPVDFFPYVVLLDKNGTIISANLDINQLPTRIAKLEAIERKARAANNLNDAAPTAGSP